MKTRRPSAIHRPELPGPASARRGRMVALAAAALSACSPFAPEPLDRAEFLARLQTQEADGVAVSVAALTPAESRRYLGEDLDRKGVQPVWLRIENRNDYPVWYLPIGTDPSYFSPFEVAYMFHRLLDADVNRRIDEHFWKSALDGSVAGRGSATGFVFTHRSEGAKYVNVEIFSSRKLQRLGFVAPVPGGKWDFQRVDFKALYPPDRIVDLDLQGLKAALEALPCCTANADGTRRGDPLNLVVVGNSPGLIFPFVERGWDLTQPFDLDAAWKSVLAFVFGSDYRSSPVSPLYAFGRPQDLALQKVRNEINQRNHLRAWLAPFTFEGEMVWVGQISRDIGVRLTTKSWYLTTHKIDPEVDADRDYLLQDLTFSGHVRRIGYVGGVGAAPASAPRSNLTGDPYFTDGRRLVVFLGREPRPPGEVEVARW